MTDSTDSGSPVCHSYQYLSRFDSCFHVLSRSSRGRGVGLTMAGAREVWYVIQGGELFALPVLVELENGCTITRTVLCATAPAYEWQ